MIPSIKRLSYKLVELYFGSSCNWLRNHARIENNSELQLLSGQAFLFEKTFSTRSILLLLPMITSAVTVECHGHVRDSHNTTVNSAHVHQEDEQGCRRSEVAVGPILANSQMGLEIIQDRPSLWRKNHEYKYISTGHIPGHLYFPVCCDLVNV